MLGGGADVVVVGGSVVVGGAVVVVVGAAVVVVTGSRRWVVGVEGGVDSAPRVVDVVVAMVDVGRPSVVVDDVVVGRAVVLVVAGARSICSPSTCTRSTAGSANGPTSA